MFKFSGKLSRSEWWGAILLNFVILIVFSFIGGTIRSAVLHGGSNSGAQAIDLIFGLANLVFYIRGMGITARRLRDAGYDRGQITAYYWLILIPIVSFFAMIAYFFIAGFSPSKITDEELRQQAEAREKAEAERLRREKEAYRRGQAEAWAKADESRFYSAGGGSRDDNAAYAEQAKKWAREETEKEQKQPAAQKGRLLPKN